MPKKKKSAIVAIALIASSAAAFLCFDHVVLLFPPETIERHLLRQTPLGSSEADVQKSLHDHGVPADIRRVHVPPSPPGDYPLTKVGGEAFIHESVDHYWFVFRTDVEAFYVFDTCGKLVDVRVRKSVDAP
jgi:hypothetical protein